MYCSNKSSMATLLQQKSFMKNLTNGTNNVVVVNGTNESENAVVAAGSTIATMSSTASRMLLPHETVVLSPALNTSTLIHQQPLIHQQTTVSNAFTTTPTVASSSINQNSSSTSASSFNSQFINHLQSNHHLSVQQIFGSNTSQNISTTTIPTTSFPSQFNSSVYTDSLFRSSSSPATTSTASLQQFASPNHQLPHISGNPTTLVNVNGTQQHVNVVPKQEPSEGINSPHYNPHQTVSESQTANRSTTTDHSPHYKSGNRNEIGAATGKENQPATATITADALEMKPVISEKEEDQDQEAEPEIDIVINNVVCSFSVRCHLNLRDIALKGFNVEFRRENGMVTMKLRKPYTTASIWSSGKITCTGATSEVQAKVAARRYSRCLEKLGFNVRFRNFRIVNVLGTCSMPWGIMIVNFSEKYKKDASYEPELHPGVTYKLYNPKATLKIFSTGSITVTAASVAFVQAAIEHIFPLVYEFRKKRTPQEKLELMKQPAFDPHDSEILIEEECDIETATIYPQEEEEDEEDDNADMFDDDEDVHITPASGTSNNTKAIHQRKKRRRAHKLRNGNRKRPAGKADNDPTEDVMYVSEDDVEELIESDDD